MKIIYGTEQINIDITNFCILNLKQDNKIIIPAGEKIRNLIFTDPAPNINKKIFVQNNENSLFFVCENNNDLIINLINYEGLFDIHKKINIKHGKFNEELPEQKLAYMFLKGNEKVLEIGGNVGRNTLVIASILKNDENLVVLESDKNSSELLNENKMINNLNFNIEAKALCKNKLIQSKWTTIESDVLLDGYNWVEICDYNYLKNKYQINFDTLVIDCEGAFYYILRDFPEILENINLIIMENDYTDINNYNYVCDILSKNGLNKVYMEYCREATFWSSPCSRNFFEVWKKNTDNNNKSMNIYISDHL